MQQWLTRWGWCDSHGENDTTHTARMVWLTWWGRCDSPGEGGGLEVGSADSHVEGHRPSLLWLDSARWSTVNLWFYMPEHNQAISYWRPYSSFGSVFHQVRGTPCLPPTYESCLRHKFGTPKGDTAGRSSRTQAPESACCSPQAFCPAWRYVWWSFISYIITILCYFMIFTYNGCIININI